MRNAGRLGLVGLVTLALAACGGSGNSDTSTGAGGSGHAGSGGAGGSSGADASSDAKAGGGGIGGFDGGGGSDAKADVSTDGAGAGGGAGAAGSGGSSTDGSAGTGGAAGSGGADGSAGSGGSPSCPAGAIQCNGNVMQVCDGQGGFSTTTDCAAQNQVCDTTFGCVACVPNTGSCNGDTSHLCKSDGSGYVDTYCDPLQGVTCDPSTFACTGDCAPNVLGQSYIGCDYWPTVTFNEVQPVFHFAVVVANTSPKDAQVHVSQGNSDTDISGLPVTVPANSVKTITLPWVTSLKGQTANKSTGQVTAETASVYATGGAYHLRSTEPVTVYQFNPLEYTINPPPANNQCGNPLGDGSCHSFTNDASLLLPTNALRTGYTVIAYHAWAPTGLTMGDFVAITATADNTHVQLVSAANTLAGNNGIPAFTKGGSYNLTLNKGDVAEIVSQGSPETVDLSGSTIASDQPIQVISGMPAVDIPSSSGYADHCEETVLPADTLGQDYLVTAPQAPPTTTTNVGNEYYVRIVALADATDLTFDPPSVHSASVLNKGAVLELGKIKADFRVSSTTQKFAVAMFMVGSSEFNNGGGLNVEGDPAQSIAVPTGQFRNTYKFLAPTAANGGYTDNYVNVVAPTGTSVVLDGTAIPSNEFVAIGGSGYSVARHKLSTTKDDHDIVSPQPFGIQVYGFGAFTSYWYPGGMNLLKL
jgi:hypothetical protein